jgi:hypothetical protein
VKPGFEPVSVPVHWEGTEEPVVTQLFEPAILSPLAQTASAVRRIVTPPPLR